jgi:hypothetical protein
MKREILSVLLAMILASTFITLLIILVITKIFILEDIRTEITGIIIGSGILGSLTWGFRPALKLLIFGKQPKLNNQQLKTQTIQLSNDLNFFVSERRQNEPAIDFKRWKETTDNMIKYSVQSNVLYNLKFDQRLADVKEEYSIRKIVDQEFEQFYKQPTNYIGIQIVSQRLATMAAKL